MSWKKSCLCTGIYLVVVFIPGGLVVNRVEVQLQVCGIQGFGPFVAMVPKPAVCLCLIF